METCAGASLNGLHLDAIANDLLEITVIHEMMHGGAYGLLDFYGEDGRTSGLRLAKESYICAESIAILRLAAALADLEPVDLPSGWRQVHSFQDRWNHNLSGRILAMCSGVIQDLMEWRTRGRRNKLTF